MSRDKVQGALRVMEALSAVDDELLERSRRATVKRKKPRWARRREMHRFMQRYGGLCAACLCLIVLGAAYYGLTQIRMGNASGENISNGSSMSGGAANQEAKDAEPISDVGGEAGGDYKAENAESAEDDRPVAVPDNMPDIASDAGPQWLDINAVVPQQEPDGRQEPDGLRENHMETAESPGEMANGSEQEEMKKLSESLQLPEGYSPVEGSDRGDSRADTSRLYQWTDGTHTLWLRITRTELSADMRFDEEPPVYTVQEEWADMIPEAGEDGYVQFALLYEDGLLAEYRGVLTKEEIQALLSSVAQ